MSRIVFSNADDLVDLIARREYGTEQGGGPEAILEANPGLSLQLPVIAMNTPIVIPDIDPTPTAEQPVKLWE